MTIRAVLFDMYGTLGIQENLTPFTDTLAAAGFPEYATPAVHHAFANDLADGVEHHEHSSSREAYNRWSRSVGVDALMAAGADGATAEKVADVYWEWLQDLQIKMRAYPEARDVLTAVRQRGLRVVVCSNWDWDIERTVQAMGLSDLVDDVYHSAKVGARKPHPSFFRHILSALSLEPGEALFVGDSWNADIVGATSAGLPAVFVDRYNSGVPDESVEVAVVPDLTGVLDLLYELF